MRKVAVELVVRGDLSESWVVELETEQLAHAREGFTGGIHEPRFIILEIGINLVSQALLGKVFL